MNRIMSAFHVEPHLFVDNSLWFKIEKKNTEEIVISLSTIPPARE